MTDVDSVLLDTVDRLLARECTPHAVAAADHEGWSRPVWSVLAEAGFPWVGVDERDGGSGGTLADSAGIIRAAGAHAAPVPIAETMLGAWCLAAAGLALPEGPLALAERPVEVVAGRLLLDQCVAWARHAEQIVAVGPGTVFALRPDQARITAGANLAGEARDRVVVDVAADDVTHGAADVAAEVEQRGALSRVLLTAGALATVAQMTVDYTHARQQFGRPVATFQAVQQHLVTVAQSAARARMAADVAVRAVAAGMPAIEIAAARVVADRAIALGTRAAHQAHGAIGVTREYPLQQYTRRLWSWRHEWGSTTEWRRRLGAEVVAAGADALFPLITGS